MTRNIRIQVREKGWEGERGKEGRGGEIEEEEKQGGRREEEEEEEEEKEI